MAKIINGKEISAKIREEIKEQTKTLAETTGITPGLAVIIVGNDPASQIYVANKEKACAEVGFYSEKFELPEETSQDELLGLIDTLNARPDIDGILVQLPLPKHINAKAVIDRIRPDKDVDAFHPVNVGKIMVGKYDFAPCTPSGVMELIHSTGISVEGKNCVVVGRSDIVGKPQSMLLLHENGTVTICHSKTEDLEKITKKADILVVAVGKAEFITGDMIKKGAVVIDVGMNRKPDGKLVGDVEFNSASEKASYITPVPGGVGPMTITMLLKNTLKASKLH